MRMMAGIARAMNLPQRPTERLDLSLISVLLPLKHFQHLQQLVHIIQGAAERVNNRTDLLDRLFD